MLGARIDTLISEILSYLFTAEYRRLNTWVDRLIESNREAYRDSSLDGFVYNGTVYKSTAATAARISNQAVKRRGLHPSLMSDMDAYQKDLKVLMDDKSFINQALFRLLDGCTTTQGIRDALPNCLADSLSCIRGLSRQGEEAFTIKNDERAMRQYRKVVPRIELYVATRMIY